MGVAFYDGEHPSRTIGYVEAALKEIEEITLRPLPTKHGKQDAINEIRKIARLALEKCGETK